MGGSHRQVVRPGKGNDGLVIGLGRAELPGKFLWRQIMMILGTGGVIDLLKQIRKRHRVPQGQADGQVHSVRARETANR